MIMQPVLKSRLYVSIREETKESWERYDSSIWIWVPYSTQTTVFLISLIFGQKQRLSIQHSSITETGDFKSNLEKILGEYICDLNVLIVDRLEILPEFRGKKIGLACLGLVFTTICSCLWRRGPKMFSVAIRMCGNGRACMAQRDAVRKAQ